MSSNPLLEKIRIPGETFRLPSRGAYYTHGELDDDVVDGEVHVMPLTTVDELALKSPDKLYTGQAVAEVFGRRIPQIKQPLNLLSKDVDYLMMCLRLVSYGDAIELTLKHDCEHAEEFDYQFSTRQFIKEAREVDPTKQVKIELDNGQVVTMRPPSFEDVLGMYLVEDKLDKMSDNEIANAISSNLAGMVASVDDIDDRVMITEWLEEIPAGWVSKITDKIVAVSDWGVDSSATIKCPNCGEDWTIQVPTNPITFFIQS